MAQCINDSELPRKWSTPLTTRSRHHQSRSVCWERCSTAWDPPLGPLSWFLIIGLIGLGAMALKKKFGDDDDSDDEE